MSNELAGKWIWIWNWRRCDGGDAARVAERLQAAGCAGVIIKASDGPFWFDQGLSWRELARQLRAHGIRTGAWGYCYGQNPAGEAQRIIETAGYGEAEFFVLDAESEFEAQPAAAEELCSAARTGLGPDYPLFFSSFAIARYHRSFPFAIFAQYCKGAAPQVYWNAFGWPEEQSLAWTFDDHVALGLPATYLFPVAGLYNEGSVHYPAAWEIAGAWEQCRSRGSLGMSFWSYEHMDESMWQAVAQLSLPTPTSAPPADGDIPGRVSTLESRVDAIERRLGVVTAPSPSRTYAVQPGDTLSGIAGRFGTDWQALYQANRSLIGADPNYILPGQLLTLP
ncbi:MAG TPA: LysM peptidoglycan-binding domain-containing protein [Dehalococcoidia bacterium]|nr:LysM peptidoglycan-binding domain-containing protein [Dehalococcoidia bacterium]